MNKDKLINGVELFYLSTLTVIIVLLTNIDTLIKVISADVEESYTFFNERVADWVDTSMSFVADNFLTPGISTFILWGIVGVVSYTLVETFFSTTKDVADEMKVEGDYVHPRKFNRTNYWLRFFGRVLAVVGFAAITLVWIGWFFTRFIPASSLYVFLATNDEISAAQKFYYLGLSLTSVFIGLFGFMLIYKIFRYFKIHSSL